MPIRGRFSTTAKDGPPCSYEVIIDNDNEVVEAKKLLEEVDVTIVDARLVGHFAIWVDAPDQWEDIGGITGLVLSENEEFSQANLSVAPEVL